MLISMCNKPPSFVEGGLFFSRWRWYELDSSLEPDSVEYLLFIQAKAKTIISISTILYHQFKKMASL